MSCKLASSGMMYHDWVTKITNNFFSCISIAGLSVELNFKYTYLDIIIFNSLRPSDAYMRQ